jgi:hypothetical protein
MSLRRPGRPSGDEARVVDDSMLLRLYHADLAGERTVCVTGEQ